MQQRYEPGPARPERPEKPDKPERPEKPRRRGRMGRLFRGYLMLVGGATTVYVLIRLLAILFVEIQKWMLTTPVG